MGHHCIRMFINNWRGVFHLIYSLTWIEINSFKLDFTITYGVFLNVERSQYFDTIQMELCLKECEKRMNCSSINFDKAFLQCNLSTSNHLDAGSEFIYDTDRTYAVINSRSPKCTACLEHESCLFLSSGESVCIATECSDARPVLSNALEEYFFDPPFLRFTLINANTLTSTCVPGKPWSYVNTGCDSPESILPNGTVTMSSVHQSDGVLDQYSLDGDKSWSSMSNTLNEWIQVELPSIYNVTAVLTKGRSNHNQWVTSYYISYKNETTSTWNQLSSVYTGNDDRNTIVTHTFESGILTRGIRLHPKTWHGHISLRFDIIGCRFYS